MPELEIERDQSSHKDDVFMRRLQTALVCLCLTTSLLSIALLLYNAHEQWTIFNLLGSVVVIGRIPSERPDPGLLERPTVYVGLVKLPADVQHAALPKKLDVFPPFLQPVDHIHRHYIFPSDGHARFTFNGRVSPGDHRILLTDHVSSTPIFCIYPH